MGPSNVVVENGEPRSLREVCEPLFCVEWVTPSRPERERVDRKCSGIDSCCHSSMCLWLLDYNLNCFVFLIPRQSTRWWGLLSWWRWTRTAWRPSSGSTKSSVRWIRITTTRSHWKSSKKQQRVTRPLYYCCSVTCKNERGGKKRARDCIND